MKRTFLFVTGIILISFVYSQNPCLPEGITFSTQEQIDSFSVNYPGCTEIGGNIIISGEDIQNLDGLSGVNECWGTLLKIHDNPSLTSLNGLGNLIMSEYIFDFYIENNDSLPSLEGLEGITGEGEYSRHVYITDNDRLKSLIGFPEFESSADYRIIITDNDSLVSLSGLESVEELELLSIKNNDALTSLEGVGNVLAIKSDWGGLDIIDNDVLMGLDGLDNLQEVEGMEIAYNSSLLNINAFYGIESVSRYFSIKDNPSLVSIDGISTATFEEIYSIKIYNNDSLSECHVQSLCAYLFDQTDYVQIFNNSPGCTSVEEVEESCVTCLTDGITITSQAQIDSFQNDYPYCKVIQGDLIIGDWEVQSDIDYLGGLNNIEVIEGDLFITNNPELETCIGIGNLTEVGGSLVIADNNNLTDLLGLHTIEIIGNELYIGDNPNLATLAGLQSLESVGFRLWVQNNYQLIDFTGLESLEYIGEELFIQFNLNLSSLNGLDNVDADSLHMLWIEHNENLSVCAIPSVCSFMDNQTGVVYITGNDEGCSSTNEVIQACEDVGINSNFEYELNLMVCPNPATSGTIIIEVLEYNVRNNSEITIFDSFGTTVFTDEYIKTPEKIIVDISVWPSGMYLAVLYENGKPIGMEKIMVR